MKRRPQCRSAESAQGAADVPSVGSHLAKVTSVGSIPIIRSMEDRGGLPLGRRRETTGEHGIPESAMQVKCYGSTLVFQTDCAGSTPATRTIVGPSA